MSDKLISEKHRADAMRSTAAMGIDGAYWQAYRMGLICQSEHHDALLASIGSPDLYRDARGRGYRNGRAFVTDARS